MSSLAAYLNNTFNVHVVGMVGHLTQWCSSEDPGNSWHRWPPPHAAIFPALDRKDRTYGLLNVQHPGNCDLFDRTAVNVCN